MKFGQKSKIIWQNKHPQAQGYICLVNPVPPAVGLLFTMCLNKENEILGTRALFQVKGFVLCFYAASATVLLETDNNAYFPLPAKCTPCQAVLQQLKIYTVHFN